MKLTNKNGFTLMEMLIVVAIIAILIAIAIPTFASVLEKTRESADIANIRSAYAEAMVHFIEGSNSDANSVTTQPMTQTKAGWIITIPDYLTSAKTLQPVSGSTVKVAIDADGSAVITAGT